jgi:hypothetical protein
MWSKSEASTIAVLAILVAAGLVVAGCSIDTSAGMLAGLLILFVAGAELLG